jgi:hypothetical protein
MTNTPITHILVATAFHGGGIISRHRSEAAAERAAARWRMSDCTCGCCGVVPVADLPTLRSDDARTNPRSPYELIR